MSTKNLAGKRVAILATDGYEQSQLEGPRQALKFVGAETVLVSPQLDSIKGWDKDQFGTPVKVDVPLAEAEYADYDALFIPDGVMNIDRLRQSSAAVEFVRLFFTGGKPVATTCHGPLILIEANVVRARKVTSCPSIKVELANAGAIWCEDAVVVDNGLITSRGPDDMPAFSATMVEELWKRI